MVCGTALRTGCFLLLLGSFLLPLRAEGLRLNLLGGVDTHPAQGRVEDYMPGVNDFPLTHAHSSWLGGFSIWGGGGTTPVRLGLMGLYHNGGGVALEDPSDGDRLSMDARSHLTAHACAGWTWVRSDLLRLSVVAGLGGTLALSRQNAEELTTQMGEIVVVEAGGSRLGLSGMAGMEGLWHLGAGWGLVTGVHLFYHAPLENHWAVSGVLGFSFAL